MCSSSSQEPARVAGRPGQSSAPPPLPSFGTRNLLLAPVRDPFYIERRPHAHGRLSYQDHGLATCISVSAVALIFLLSHSLYLLSTLLLR